MAATDLTVAVDKRGRTTPLGDFVFGLLEAKGMSVSEFARRSQLSRSFLYLLRDDKQVPSLDTHQPTSPRTSGPARDRRRLH